MRARAQSSHRKEILLLLRGQAVKGDQEEVEIKSVLDDRAGLLNIFRSDREDSATFHT